MAIELKQSLRLSQQLVITPQLQQAIKLLQLSRLELVDLIQTELTENPILEEAAQIEDEEVPKEMAAEIEAEAAPDKSHEAQPEVEMLMENLKSLRILIGKIILVPTMLRVLKEDLLCLLMKCLPMKML